MPTDSSVSLEGSRERGGTIHEFAENQEPRSNPALKSTALETLHESAWLLGKVALKTLC